MENIEEAKTLLSEATKKIDQACTKGVIVKNTASSAVASWTVLHADKSSAVE